MKTVHRILFLASLSIWVAVLSACASTVETIKPPAENDRKVHIDERLLEECTPVMDILRNPQPSDVLEQHKKDVIAYNDCKNGKHELIVVIRKAFGL